VSKTNWAELSASDVRHVCQDGGKAPKPVSDAVQQLPVLNCPIVRALEKNQSPFNYFGQKPNSADCQP